MFDFIVHRLKILKLKNKILKENESVIDVMRAIKKYEQEYPRKTVVDSLNFLIGTTHDLCYKLCFKDPETSKEFEDFYISPQDIPESIKHDGRSISTKNMTVIICLMKRT